MTPISATGPCRASPERGFTLVEVMVAMLVMALLTAAILITVPDPGPRLSDEAERLAGRLSHARETALIANRPVEMAFDAQGWSFRQQRRGAWTTLDGGPVRAGRWPEGLTVAVDSADGRAAVRFDTTGGAEPAAIRLANRRTNLSVVVDAQGEVRVDDRPR